MLNKQYQRFIKILSVISIVFMMTANYSIQAQSVKNLSSNSNLKLLVTDKTTGKYLAHKTIVIESNNGVRCTLAPCPNNRKNWTGQTDKHGYVVIPGNIRQNFMSLTISGYILEELNRTAQKSDRNDWTIALQTE